MQDGSLDRNILPTWTGSLAIPRSYFTKYNFFRDVPCLWFAAGVTEETCGLRALVREAYSSLGLQTYFTSGETETKAWTIRAGWTAPQAAGVIHSDFERYGVDHIAVVAMILGCRTRSRRKILRESGSTHVAGHLSSIGLGLGLGLGSRLSRTPWGVKDGFALENIFVLRVLEQIVEHSRGSPNAPLPERDGNILFSSSSPAVSIGHSRT